MPAVSTRVARHLEAALVPALLLGAGCSLVKIDTHTTPLPRGDVQARLATREFATGMVRDVVRTADALGGPATPDVQLRMAAIRWKLGTSVAARRAALRTDPALSLVDTWALASQMDRFLRTGAGSTLFGERQAEATEVSGRLLKQIATTARSVNATGVGADAERFVEEYAEKFPLADLDFEREPVYPHWEAHRGGADAVTATVGTPAEVMSDVADRLTLYGDQLGDELRWRLELLSVDPRYDTKELREMAKGLDAELKRIAAVAEQSPELARESIRDLRETVDPAVDRLDVRWQETLDAFTSERRAISAEVTAQREALTETFRTERAAVVADTNRLATELTERVFARVREVVRDLVIGGVVLALVVLGVPFGFGFLAGRGFRRARAGTGEA
jgi:hypothetical protein